MIITTKLPKDKNGNITSPTSSYKPDEKTKKRTAQMLNDFSLAYQTQQKSFAEFNDKSLLTRQNEDQKSFNSYQAPRSNDPDEQWRSNAIRPIVRNRVVSIAAHVTGSLIFPQVYAQNDNQDEDRVAAEVMRDLMQYAADQSNYERTFLASVIAALVNPAVVIHTEFAEVYRTVKNIKEDGTWTEEKVLDEERSGFQDTIVPLDELFIGDVYENNIQRQPFLIWRRAIDYTVAHDKYGDREEFKKWVRPGMQVLFSSDADTFYEQFDSDIEDRLVEEVIYYNRQADLQLVFVNGVLLTDPDQPNPRKDKRYPFVKGGYEFIDEGRFFYYCSLVKKLSSDEDLVNTLYRMVIDGTYLQLMPPVAVFGNEDINSAVMIPGVVTNFSDPNAKVQPLGVGGNLAAGFTAIQKVEQSMSESSNDVLQSGQSIEGSQTAFEISRLEQNAKTMLGMFAKMIAFMVRDYGELRISDIIQYLTVADVGEITDELKYRTFIIPDKTVEGRKKTRRIEFRGDMQMPQNYDEELQQSFSLLDEEGGMDADREICRVNPTLYRDLRFRTRVQPDMVTPPSDNVKKALNLELYDRAIQNPLANQEALYQRVLLGSYDVTKNDVDAFTQSQEQMQALQQPDAAEQPQGSPLAKVLGQKVGSPMEMATQAA